MKKHHKGTFKPGISGNPTGRPKTDKTIQELAKKHTKTALETLVSIVQNTKSSDSARVQASNALLDRGWGKPPQYNEGNSQFIGVSVNQNLEVRPEINSFDIEERIKQLAGS